MKTVGCLSIILILISCQKNEKKSSASISAYDEAIIKMFESSTESGTQEAFILNMENQPAFDYDNLKCYMSQSKDYQLVLDGVTRYTIAKRAPTELNRKIAADRKVGYPNQKKSNGHPCGVGRTNECE